MTTVYALQIKNRLSFVFYSRNKEDFYRRLNETYFNWRGTRPKGSDPTLEEYMEDKVPVKITIERIENEPN